MLGGANISSMDLMLMISGGLVSLDHFLAGLSYDRWIGHSGSSLLCCKRIQGEKNTRISEWNGWKASFVGMHSRESISEFIDTHLIFGFSLGRALQLEF